VLGSQLVRAGRLLASGSCCRVHRLSPLSSVMLLGPLVMVSAPLVMVLDPLVVVLGRWSWCFQRLNVWLVLVELLAPLKALLGQVRGVPCAVATACWRLRADCCRPLGVAF
jgi:hypothetical protein